MGRLSQACKLCLPTRTGENLAFFRYLQGKLVYDNENTIYFQSKPYIFTCNFPAKEASLMHGMLYTYLTGLQMWLKRYCQLTNDKCSCYYSAGTHYERKTGCRLASGWNVTVVNKQPAIVIQRCLTLRLTLDAVWLKRYGCQQTTNKCWCLAAALRLAGFLQMWVKRYGQLTTAAIHRGGATSGWPANEVETLRSTNCRFNSLQPRCIKAQILCSRAAQTSYLAGLQMWLNETLRSTNYSFHSLQRRYVWLACKRGWNVTVN